MATLAPTRPTPYVCQEKQRLSNEFLDAWLQVIELQSQEGAPVLSGGLGLWSFDLALMQARQKRNEARRMYLLHLQEHGC